MKSLLTIIALLLFLTNCTELEFVYKKNDSNILEKNTALVIIGDDRDAVYDVMLGYISVPNNPKYKIVIDSSRTDTATVIDTDATASKFSIKYSLLYDLYNLEKQCTVVNKKIVTESSYDAKSAGYSFGTDLSKQETALRSLEKNISIFFVDLNKIDNFNICDGQN